MTRKFFSSLTATATIILVGTVPSSLAEEIRTQSARGSYPENHRSDLVSTPEKPPNNSTKAEGGRSEEVVKVGEYQGCAATDRSCDAEARQAIASLYAHEWQGREAATLYVKDIPVLLFLGASADTETETKVGDTASSTWEDTAQPHKKSSSGEQGDESSDPVWQASAIAAQLNQMYRQNLDAESIKARWHPELENYVIEVEGEVLVEFSDRVTFVNDTDNPVQNTLETTNKLRRLLGDAPPLASIPTQPQPKSQPRGNTLLASLRGYASWYGPGFHGRLSASGERFNQYDLTAAHRTLPFGTRVRVTNLRNGSSVVVRINDRGPYHGNRIIDLSRAAAQVLGLTRMGVAPVRVEVLGRPR